ncbi:hypothetical protein [Thermus caliditerrae]|uniref:hypothetical protein n=1 Tax=Thermus caliditerrae TaxID=1330700 RepID=UPI001F264F7C|nr:hypothetical protein [Thermus caliditerrae]
MKIVQKALLLILALAVGLALAAGTPAGTAITNQASASYIDSAGQPRTTQSNLVTTIVQQVYNFTITPDGTESAPGQIRNALPGGQVLFNYVVTNTGNGTDTINLTTVQGTSDNFDLLNPKIYLDANCNGNVDAGEAQVTSVTLAADQSVCVVVAAQIPTTAMNGQYGNLNLVGTSAGNNSVTDNNNWARAVATTAAALTGFKAASPSGTVQPGDTITYTISGSNTGGSPAYGIPVTVDGNPKTGILIEDVIPNGLTVTTMPTGSAGAGTVRFVYHNGSAWQTLTSGMLPITGDGTKKIGMLIEGTGAFFPQGAQYTFSFRAQVPSNASAGDSYANTAVVRFDANGDGDADDPGETVTTNTTTNTVAATYQPVVGYPGTVTLGNETQVVATAYAGQTVSFTNVVRNDGNAPDSFNLSLQNSTFPTGTVCAIYASDGTTPLSGPVGPLAPGATQNVVVKCQLPASYFESPADGNTTTYQVELWATSVNDPSKSDLTTNQVVDILPGYAVDLAARGFAGDNDPNNDNPPMQAANPGQTVYFPLEVYNAGQNPDVYNLTATLPMGWSVVFYPDDDCDGTPDGAPITSTALLNPGQKQCFVAAVSVPAGAAPGANPVSFTATSTTLGSVSDTVSTTVNVNTVAQVLLDPDRFGTVTSPGTITYTHTLINNSNAPAYCDISGSGGAYSWTYQYSTDGTNWYGGLADVYVAPNGGTATIYVRVQVPGGEPVGRTDVNTVTANCVVNGVPATDTATETTTIVGGELRLEKSVDKSTAYPGDTLTYTITAENIGTGDLTKVIVSDPIPAHTTFVSVSATISGFPAGATVLYSTDGTTWSPTAPSSVPTGGVVYVAVDTDGDNTITDADVMPPAAKITITLRVRVQ